MITHLLVPRQDKNELVWRKGSEEVGWPGKSWKCVLAQQSPDKPESFREKHFKSCLLVIWPQSLYTCQSQLLLIALNTPFKNLPLTGDRWTGAPQLRTVHRSASGDAGSCSHPHAAADAEIHPVVWHASEANKMNTPAIKSACLTWGQYFLPIWSECTVSNMARARSLTNVQSKTQLQYPSLPSYSTLFAVFASVGFNWFCSVRFHSCYSSYIVTWGEWLGKTRPVPVSQWKGKPKKVQLCHFKKHDDKLW